MTSRIVAPPRITRGKALDGSLALLLSVGCAGWPVLIAADDFELVTDATGFRLWGVQRGQVVVGDDDPRAGRPVVARLLAKLDQRDHGLAAAFRDGNPLNLLRSNLGIMSRAARRTWWLVLRPGEVDAVYDVRGFPNQVPEAITRHRALVPEPRPMSCPWPLPARTWHRGAPPKVGTLDGPTPPYPESWERKKGIVGLDWARRHELVR